MDGASTGGRALSAQALAELLRTPAPRAAGLDEGLRTAESWVDDRGRSGARARCPGRPGKVPRRARRTPEP
ncbi:hypothetical protein [Streptomyces sp. NPDC002540]